ncbi:MAG: hypothetical protein ACTSR0_01335 [Candidatus Asgardarchaeia archaeon]
MKVKKTIKAKIVFLTKIKKQLLEEEYQNLQRFLHGKDVELYSANKQQALRFYKKIKPDKEYPLSIMRDLLKIERRNTKIAEYWARIPVKGRRGGVWVVIKPHEDILPEYEIGESKVFRRNGGWYIHITIFKEVELKESYAHILAVDVGERVMACVCGTWNSLKPSVKDRW